MAVLSRCFCFSPVIPCLRSVRYVMLLFVLCAACVLSLSFYSAKSSSECYPSIIGFFFSPSSFITPSLSV